jgi:hypothetical protein
MNVKRLDGRLLNFWVAKSGGLSLSAQESDPSKVHDPDSGFWHPYTYNPASDWAHAGAIVSNEWFAIEDMLLEWFGPHWSHIPAITENPLTWFMRAYVATQFGDEVEEVTAPAPLHVADDARPPVTASQLMHVQPPSLVRSLLKQINW